MSDEKLIPLAHRCATHQAQPLVDAARGLVEAVVGTVPEPPAADPEWDKFVEAYGRAAAATKNGRPTMLATAQEMSWYTEKPLRRLLHARGIKDFRTVHGLLSSPRG